MENKKRQFTPVATKAKRSFVPVDPAQVTRLRSTAFPTLSSVSTASRIGTNAPAARAQFNRTAFPTLSTATPISRFQPVQSRNVTRKGAPGFVSEFLAPTRGFRDEEIKTAKPGVVDMVKATTRYGAEILGGVLELNSLIKNNTPLKDATPAEREWIDKLQAYAQPKTVGEASSMRGLDIATLGVGGTLGAAGRLTSKLSKVDDVGRVLNLAKREGLMLDEVLATRIAKETSQQKILELITQVQKQSALDLSKLRALPKASSELARPVIGDGIVPKVSSGITKGAKESGLTRRVGEIFPDAKASYKITPRPTTPLAVAAKNLVREDVTTAERLITSGAYDDKTMAVYSEWAKEIGTKAKNTTNPVEKLALNDKLAQVTNDFARKLTDAGRFTQASSILSRMTPEGMTRFAARELQKYNEQAVRLGKKPLKELDGERVSFIQKEMDEIAKMPEGVAKEKRVWELQDTIKSWVPTPAFDKTVAVWRAGLLTGIKTTGLNISSNLFHGVSEFLKQIPAATFDRMASLVTGSRTTTATVRKAMSGAKTGTIKGKRYFFDGFDERKIGAKLDYEKVNFNTKFFQTYTDTVFRLMGATDQPFYYAAYARSMFDQALANGMNKGLKGRKLADFAEDLVQTPTAEMERYAAVDASTAVFANETALGSFAKKAQNLRFGQVPVGRVAIPFAQTPSAVAMQMIHYSPLGFLKPTTRVFSALRTKYRLKTGKLSPSDLSEMEAQGRKMFDQRLWSQEMGRATIGTAFLASGAYLLNQGKVSLQYPESKRERGLWKLEGRKPNSILVKFPWEKEEKWRSPMVLGPAGMVMLAGAHLENAVKTEGSPTGAAVLAVGGVWQSFMEQTFLVGLNDAMSAIQAPMDAQQGLGTYIPKLIASTVPTLVSDVARATDPYERISTGDNLVDATGDKIKARIPGARRTLNPQYNVLGQRRDSVGNAAEIMADPTRPSPVNDTPVIQEYRRLFDAGYEVSPTPIGNRTAGYKSLSEEDNLRMRRSAGRIINGQVEKLIQMPEYRNATDEQKAKILKKINDQASIVARAQIIERTLRDLTPREQRELLIQYKDEHILTEDVAKLLSSIM